MTGRKAVGIILVLLVLPAFLFSRRNEKNLTITAAGDLFLSSRLLERDRGRKGLLDENDKVIHHLNGFSEIISIKEMMKYRSSFEIMRFKKKNTISKG